MCFEPERWLYAIEKGIEKGIDMSVLQRLTLEDARIQMYKRIRDGKYTIFPPHTAELPKPDGGKRIVYVNEAPDRILLSIINDLLFEITPEMVHPRCRSYQKGKSCGATVQDVAARIGDTKGIIGWKSDLSKYFDSVPLKYIDEAFDAVEAKHGHSAIIDVLRKYYHSDIYIDIDGEVKTKYQSLKQGCAVASWLADVIIYHIDEKLSTLNGFYIRYSDDMNFIGPDYPKAMKILGEELCKMQMQLNPKKVEYIDHLHWFKFLGFSIKGAEISISSSQIKTFQKEIESRTIKVRGISYKKALNSVLRYLYGGNGEYSWATRVLPIITSKKDIETLNTFVTDCLRAVITGKRKIGGLGFDKIGKDGCIVRGRGRNVRANRLKTDKLLEGYVSIQCMYNAIHTHKPVFRALVSQYVA